MGKERGEEPMRGWEPYASEWLLCGGGGGETGTMVKELHVQRPLGGSTEVLKVESMSGNGSGL